MVGNSLTLRFKLLSPILTSITEYSLESNTVVFKNSKIFLSPLIVSLKLATIEICSDVIGSSNVTLLLASILAFLYETNSSIFKSVSSTIVKGTSVSPIFRLIVLFFTYNENTSFFVMISCSSELVKVSILTHADILIFEELTVTSELGISIGTLKLENVKDVS